MNEDLLMDIQRFAAEAHKGQRRKYAQEDYINHPIRVNTLCRNATSSIPVLAAALLHDVLEDTDISNERMKIFLHQVMPAAAAEATLQLVIDLTDVYTQKAFPSLNRRQRKEKEHQRLAMVQPNAQTIKYADIIDNCMDMADSGDDFAPRFLQEYRSLLTKIPAGDPGLYTQAKKVVEQALKKLGQ